MMDSPDDSDVRSFEFTCRQCGQTVAEEALTRPEICSACGERNMASIREKKELPEAPSGEKKPPAPPPPPKKKGTGLPPPTSGNSVTITFRTVPVCNRCKGQRKIAGKPCPECGGSGVKKT